MLFQSVQKIENRMKRTTEQDINKVDTNRYYSTILRMMLMMESNVLRKRVLWYKIFTLHTAT